jgi:hypothetical protein
VRGALRKQRRHCESCCQRRSEERTNESRHEQGANLGSHTLRTVTRAESWRPARNRLLLKTCQPTVSLSSPPSWSNFPTLANSGACACVVFR